MHRGEIGTYDITSFGSESVHAFVPMPLPPQPPIVLSGTLQQLLESATLALGRLDGLSALPPGETVFLYSYVRREAVHSSQIEGIRSSISDLLLFELEQSDGIPQGDADEVSNHVAALQHGLRRLREGLPLSSRLLCEIHAVLMSSERGSGKLPGEFRRSQNWIGGMRPGNAVFVPPPHTVVPSCMTELERFLHAEGDGLSVLLRAGLAHVQFETIHPFLDGNGRVGRLLITLLLCDAGILREPLLHLSLYLKHHRGEYYALLDHVRRTGDWEEWLTFFLEGVQQTAEGACSAAQRLTRMFGEHRERMRAASGRRAGSVLRVHDALARRVALSVSAACRMTGLTFPTVASALNLLVAHGVAREVTGRRRNRVFVYDQYLSLLND